MASRPLTLLLTTLVSVQAFVLTSDAVWVVSPTELPAFTVALRDSHRDVYKVLGALPNTLSSPPSPNSLPAGTPVIYVGTPQAAPWLSSLLPNTSSACWGGWESHCVLAGVVDGGPVLVATGTGVRGAMYALYTLSERVLGVNPLYLFTDDQPTYVGSVNVPDTFAVSVLPPLFKFRGYFINDEDLTALSHPDPVGRSPFDTLAFDRLCETLLRLKGNVILPATNPFPDSDLYAVAGRRGLASTHHHYDLLGGNVFSFPLPASDWNWSLNPGTMSDLWRSAIAAQANNEVIWSVGLRGLNDEAYECPDPVSCGAAISQAMANQTAWIREVQPNADIVTYLWDEALDLLIKGLLIVPQGVKIVYTDAGDGFVRISPDMKQYCDGVYYHNAMYDYRGNQLTEMVPVDRIIQQLGAVVDASNSTFFFMDNVSDLRPAVMTTQATLAFSWDPTPFQNGTPITAANSFYASWGAAQHGLPPSAATSPSMLEFASIWSAYFQLPYIQTGHSDQFISLQTIGFATAAAPSIRKSGSVPANLVSAAAAAVTLLSNNTDPSGKSVSSATAALLARALALRAALPPSRAGFFTSHTLLQMTLQARGVAIMVNVSTALTAAARGDFTTAAAASAAADAAAQDLLTAMREAELASAPDVWRGMYASDVLDNFGRVRASTRNLAAACAAPNQPSLPLPAIDTSNRWYEWEVYQKTPAALANYPFISGFNPLVAWSVNVRINCVFSDVTAGTCTPSSDGGRWRQGGAATLQVLTSPTLREADPLTIRFTTDGSTPTSTSAPYIPGHPIVLSDVAVGGKVVLKAGAFTPAGVLAGGVRTTEWVEW